MSGSSPQHAKPLLSDSSYDVLKKSTTIVLPATAALYVALAQIWHLPKPEEVAGTIAAVNTFLGIVLGVSSRTYQKSGAKYSGVIEVSSPPDGSKKIFSLNLATEPEDLERMDEVTFKVNTDVE